jgi:hypothetical protein
MRFEKEFVVDRPHKEVAGELRNDRTLAALFPDTRIEHRPDGSRETITSYSAFGSSREIRFVFTPQDDGGLRFSKICDGNVWRSLDGQIDLEAIDDRMTRVILELEGRTRAFVPEITIRVPMRDQIEQMAKSLRTALESGPGGV